MGPTIRATENVIMFSAFAAGTSGRPTSAGMIAPRVGWLMPDAPECRATRAYSTGTDSSPAQACAAMPTVVSHMTADEVSATRRRSCRSAIAPPYRPATTSGTSAARPSRPTANEEPVRANTSRDTATSVSCVPTYASVLPSHSRR